VRPIREGDRGAAVEDVQKRLITLGVDLGPTGVDGVFLGATLAAVRAFQRARGLDEDGEVGDHTWAALVDATFTLGDRLLYLRHPYLHGADVRALQGAMNALGFACGVADGIFGTYTEGAVRDFQSNTGLGADGIVGLETVRAIDGLRHVWSDKPTLPPIELRAAPARSAAVLRHTEVVLVADAASQALADRIVNLAHASEPDARVSVSDVDHDGPAALVIELTTTSPGPSRTVLVREGGEALSRRMAAAVASADRAEPRVIVHVEHPSTDEHSLQSLAVSLIDGLCLGLAGRGSPVLQ
jgi:peptidoglycan hydrolase-like protein with peptidoglycan-binding domain